MPRYFFHIHDGKLSTDRKGTTLRDANAARREAALLAAGLLSDHHMAQWDGLEWSIEVVGEDHLPVAEVRFSRTSQLPIVSGRG